ncbi:MAG: flagellar hook-basal body complex protein [bacterium]
MVTRSLFTGVSGLQSHFDKMDTLSNNISNLNTPGFKKSNVVFKSFISQQTATATAPSETRGGTNPQSVGLGVTTGSVNLDMSQGQLQRTGVNTDMALQGDGFFTVRQAGSNTNLFTRAGSFQFDSNGKLVDPANGNVVQGYNANVENGEIKNLVSQGQPEDIQVTEAMESIPGSATTFQELSGNLDASEGVGIDPVEVGFDGSKVRFEFERYHPTKEMYKFNAVWTQNPPSGKQTGDTVVDKVTGRELQGIMKLNDQGQVEGVFQNPDANFSNGIEQLEAAEDNGTNYTISENGIQARDQQGLMADLQNQNWNGELRMKMIGDPDLDSNGEYTVQWQDDDGNWNYVIEDGTNGPGAAGSPVGFSWPSSLDSPPASSTPFVGEMGSDERLRRDIDGDGNVDRDGELEFKAGLFNDTQNTVGDEIYFSPKGNVSGDNGTGLLNRKGQEVMNEDGTIRQEFRWGGSGSETFRVKQPVTTSGNADLKRVYNYDESNLNLVGNNTQIDGSVDNALDEIENKEFVIEGLAGGDYEVYADLSGDGNIDTTSAADQLQNAAGGTTFSAGNDERLFDGANDLGISIAAEDWENPPAAGERVKFAVTEARSSGSDDRAYSVASDGDGNETALFLPQDQPPSNMNFGPNLNDTSGIMSPGSPDLTNLVATTGSGGTASKKNDSEVQTVASSDVFDSQGNQHTLNYTFEKQDTNEWIYHATDPTPVNPNDPELAGFGKITFTENGQVDQVNSFNSQVPQQYPPQGPAQDVEAGSVYFNPPEETLQNAANLDQGAAPVELDPDFSNISQFAGESNLSVADQDGSAQGGLTSLSFDQTGTLQGSYDNGERRDLAQVAVSQFQNAEGLSKEGGTYFAESANSGRAQVGTAGSGGRGTVTPGALERSNVELSSQFTQVISTQRGFQANTRTITTTDQMVQSVLQLI